MRVNDIDIFTNHNVSENGEEAKDCGQRCFIINDQVRNIVDFEAIGKVSNAFSVFVGMRDNYNLERTWW